jgi:hypothetical protein
MIKETIVGESKARRVEDAPPIGAEAGYRFENGTLYVPPSADRDPFIHDNGFDALA